MLHITPLRHSPNRNLATESAECMIFSPLCSQLFLFQIETETQSHANLKPQTYTRLSTNRHLIDLLKIVVLNLRETLTSKTFITHVQRLQSQDLLLYGVLARHKKRKQIKRE